MHSMLFFSGGGHLRPLEAAKSQDFGPFEKKITIISVSELGVHDL